MVTRGVAIRGAGPCATGKPFWCATGKLFPSSVPGDFADEDSLPWITAEVMKRSKLEEEDRAARRCLEEELNNLRYEQGVAASRQDEEKRKKWEEEMQDQSSEYDFSSDSE